MPNPQVRSFSSSTIEVVNPIYLDAVVGHPIEIEEPTYAFAGVCLALYAPTGGYSYTWSDIPGLDNAKAILADELYWYPGGPTFQLTRIIVGGEIYADKVLFVDEDDNINTIPAGADDSYLLQLRDNGLIVKFGDNITLPDFIGCGPDPMPG